MPADSHIFWPCWAGYVVICLRGSQPAGFPTAGTDLANSNAIISYEALPSNYGLGANMLAGAFAGIAVGSWERQPKRPHLVLIIWLFRSTR